MKTKPGARRTLSRGVLCAGAALVLTPWLIHLYEAPESYRNALYGGTLFALTAAIAIVAAIGIYRRTTWGWNLGLIVAPAGLAMYIAGRGVGLLIPDADGALAMTADEWFQVPGMLSWIVQGLYVLLFAYAAGSFGGPDVRRLLETSRRADQMRSGRYRFVEAA